MQKCIAVLATYSIVFLFCSHPAYAGWEQLSDITPANRGVYCFATIDSFIIAGTDWGLFRSSNNNTIWYAVDSGIDPSIAALGAYALTIHGNKVFAAVNGIIYRSTNDGASWMMTMVGLQTSPGTYIIVTSLCSNGSTLFAGTRGYGVYRSTNNGDSWIVTDTNTLPANSQILALATNGETTYALSEQSGVYRSSNGGTSWNTIDSGLDFAYTEGTPLALTLNNDTLILATYMNGIYVSTNSGDQWNSTPDSGVNTYSRTSYSLAINNGTIYWGTDIGLYLSTNMGRSWSQADSTFSSTVLASSIKIINNLILVGTASSLPDGGIGAGKGIFISSDHGQKWITANNGLTNLPIVALIVSGSNIVADASSNTTGFLSYSSDNGGNWSADTGWLHGILRISGFSESNDKLFAGTNDNIYYSTDHGFNWVTQDNNFNYSSILSLASSGNIIFAGVESRGVYRSLDDGDTWTAMDSGLPNQTNIYAITINGDNVFASASYNGNTGMMNRVYRSTINGNIWTTASNGITDPWVYTITTCKGNIVAGTDSGTFVSTDNGGSWFSTARGGVYQNLTSFAVYGSNIFAGTLYGVYLSTDKGLTWQDVNENLPFYGIGVNTLAIGNNSVYAGTNYTGIWRRPLSDFGINSVTEFAPPLTSSLISNYPNPFSGMTNIDLQMPNETLSTLKIYNMLGEQVADLTPQLHGQSTIEFNAAGLQPGVYFCKGISGTREFTSKLVVVK